MATIGHLAAGLVGGSVSERWLALTLWLVFVSFLPDADVIAFKFGIPYEAPFGHRGASHSFAFALALGALTFATLKLSRRERALLVGGLTTLVCASHGLLDALTDGGKGIALLWPLTAERYFFPWRPIPVAPIGAGMLSARGLYVLAVEAAYFMPALVAAFVWRAIRRRSRRRSPPP